MSSIPWPAAGSSTAWRRLGSSLSQFEATNAMSAGVEYACRRSASELSAPITGWLRRIPTRAASFSAAVRPCRLAMRPAAWTITGSVTRCGAAAAPDEGAPSAIFTPRPVQLRTSWIAGSALASSGS